MNYIETRRINKEYLENLESQLKRGRIIMKILGMIWLIETLAVLIFYHTEE